MMSEILHREERRLNEFESEEAMSTLVQFETFEEKLADVAFRRKLVNNLQIWHFTCIMLIYKQFTVTGERMSCTVCAKIYTWNHL
ncbi:hypothetical protein LSH36_1331g00001 [Paralvinella palmiformis]|uniref:Uncharacterized protein n=1 Tax=Paralvinella palmiformis TaxID=53620 RepID=A0AAD9MNL2_9ANNE|nr:hypothetical protein LSH36_1331g00001 [Paralvinella palmiformis]